MVDLIIFSGLITCVLLGVIRGFTSDMLGLMTWVGAILVTSYAFSPVQDLARQYISQPIFADLAALLSVFLGTLILLVCVAKTISKTVQKSVLSGLDRSLGILSGAFRGMVIMTIAFSVSLLFWHPGELPKEMQKSKLSGLLAASSRTFYNRLIPQDLYPKRIVDHLYGPDQIDRAKLSTDELVHSLSNPQAGPKNSKRPQKKDHSKTHDKSPNKDASLTKTDRKELDNLVREVQ